MINYKKGFSLIELLISISIIGIITTIVLSSVSNSRARAYDSKVKQQLTSFRTAAEIYLSMNGRYNAPEAEGTEINTCNTGMFNNVEYQNGSPGLYIAEGNIPDFTDVYCGANDTAYAVKATLYSNNQYWCVDSKGASMLLNGTPSPDTICS